MSELPGAAWSALFEAMARIIRRLESIDQRLERIESAAQALESDIPTDLERATGKKQRDW